MKIIIIRLDWKQKMLYFPHVCGHRESLDTSKNTQVLEAIPTFPIKARTLSIKVMTPISLKIPQYVKVLWSICFFPLKLLIWQNQYVLLWYPKRTSKYFPILTSYMFLIIISSKSVITLSDLNVGLIHLN